MQMLGLEQKPSFKQGLSHTGLHSSTESYLLLGDVATEGGLTTPPEESTTVQTPSEHNKLSFWRVVL